MKALLAFALSLMVAIPALAQAPANGNYKSTDLNGSMYTGFYSETWNGGPMSVNNTVNEASWDGSALGTQWKWYCAYVSAPPSLVYDGVDGTTGNGQKIWQVFYTGGMAWLSGTGPWAGGDSYYEATVDMWIATVTETYSNFVEVGTVKTVNASASFVGYPDACIFLALSNLEKHDDGQTLPAGYPDFLDNACGSLGTTGPGEWGEVDDITYDVLNCPHVGTEESTWGSVKARYR